MCWLFNIVVIVIAVIDTYVIIVYLFTDNYYVTDIIIYNGAAVFVLSLLHCVFYVFITNIIGFCLADVGLIVDVGLS